MDSPNLNIVAPINFTGYGVAAANIVKAMQEEVNVALFPISRTEAEPWHRDAIMKALKVAQYPDFHAPCLRIYHQNDMSQMVGRDQHGGFPFFELDTLNDVDVHALGSLDVVFVASEWAGRVVEKYLPRSTIFVAPLGVDTAVFDPDIVGPRATPNYVFLNVGKWEVRKGHDVLANIFNAAFKPTDDVELWMIPNNPIIKHSEQVEWTQRYTDTPMGRAGKVKVFPWLNSQDAVARIMRAADAGIFPSRAEGWNLELLEMMALGKPVVTTNYSAHTEFCTPDNSYLVPVDEVEPAFDNKWFNGEGHWATLRVDIIIERMREVFNKRPANPAGVETGKKFSWQNTAKALLRGFA